VGSTLRDHHNSRQTDSVATLRGCWAILRELPELLESVSVWLHGDRLGDVSRILFFHGL